MYNSGPTGRQGDAQRVDEVRLTNEERQQQEEEKGKNRLMCIAWHPITTSHTAKDRTAGRHDIEHVTEGRRKSSYA